MKVDVRGRLPGVLFLAGVGAVVAGTFLPWRLATTPATSLPGGQFLAGSALVFGGMVGLAMLVRGSNSLAAVVGILLALMLTFLIVVEYGEAENLYTATCQPPTFGSCLRVTADFGPGPIVSAAGAIGMIMAAVIGLAKRRVAAAPRPAQPEPGLPSS